MPASCWTVYSNGSIKIPPLTIIFILLDSLPFLNIVYRSIALIYLCTLNRSFIFYFFICGLFLKFKPLQYVELCMCLFFCLYITFHRSVCFCVSCSVYFILFICRFLVYLMYVFFLNVSLSVPVSKFKYFIVSLYLSIPLFPSSLSLSLYSPLPSLGSGCDLFEMLSLMLRKALFSFLFLFCWQYWLN